MENWSLWNIFCGSTLQVSGEFHHCLGGSGFTNRSAGEQQREPLYTAMAGGCVCGTGGPQRHCWLCKLRGHLWADSGTEPETNDLISLIMIVPDTSPFGLNSIWELAYNYLTLSWYRAKLSWPITDFRSNPEELRRYVYLIRPRNLIGVQCVDRN